MTELARERRERRDADIRGTFNHFQRRKSLRQSPYHTHDKEKAGARHHMISGGFLFGGHGGANAEEEVNKIVSGGEMTVDIGSQGRKLE
ncbi:hypothetical protein HDU97_004924 [Phlyctochytrium planicorne]|nr:hypothetical protein HDU97_004924 [Phlyctochytrium planicorne]